MIGEEPDDIALTILRKNKKGADAGMGDDEDEDMGAEAGDMGPAALKGMYSAMKSGDFKAAFDALRSAVEYCKDED